MVGFPSNGRACRVLHIGSSRTGGLLGIGSLARVTGRHRPVVVVLTWLLVAHVVEAVPRTLPPILAHREHRLTVPAHSLGRMSRMVSCLRDLWLSPILVPTLTVAECVHPLLTLYPLLKTMGICQTCPYPWFMIQWIALPVQGTHRRPWPRGWSRLRRSGQLPLRRSGQLPTLHLPATRMYQCAQCSRLPMGVHASLFPHVRQLCGHL